MPDTMKRFNEIAKAKFASAIPRLVVERLNYAGEVYLHMQSGRAHIIHLGDRGAMDENTLTYVDKEGQVHVIFLANVEEIKNHLGEEG
jgi:hypothetical protein